MILQFHRFRRKKSRPPVIPTITETLPPSPLEQPVEGFSAAPNTHRNDTSRSNLSSADPLGLSVLYEPNCRAPVVDIIFVHGLGGTSQKTWSRNRDLHFFWPREWLPLEPGFEQARVLSFGYNAHFASSGRDNVLDITDFAKDLLFGMKYGLNDDSERLDIGKVQDTKSCSRNAL